MKIINQIKAIIARSPAANSQVRVWADNGQTRTQGQEAGLNLHTTIDIMVEIDQYQGPASELLVHISLNMQAIDPNADLGYTFNADFLNETQADLLLKIPYQFTQSFEQADDGAWKIADQKYHLIDSSDSPTQVQDYTTAHRTADTL